MTIKKYLILILITLIFDTAIFAAGNDDTSTKIDNYKKGANLIEQAKELERENKLEKSAKKFGEAIKYLIITNKNNPNQPNTLNYLGYASRKIGKLEIAEKYYLEGLALDALHIGINEYLGELYVETNRIDKAKERLKILQNCKCEEFEELQTLISKN